MPSLPARAWLVVALLWPVAMLNYLDRQMLSTLKTSVMEGIPSIGTNENFGLIMATFMYVYAILSPVGGFIGDRFNRRLTLILSLLVWSAVTFATGLATTFEGMLVLRGLMGISEAFYIPTALAMIAEFHPGPTRTRAVGIHQTGIYVGLALGGIGGYIAATTGSWRNAFYLFGLVGILYAVVLYFSLPSSANIEGSANEPRLKPRIWDSARVLGSMGAFWLLVAYFTLPAIAGWVMKNWMPTHLQDAFKLSEASAGMWANSMPVVGSVLGAVFGGWLADLWSTRTTRGRIFASASGTTLLAGGLVVLGSSNSLTQAILGMLLFGLGWGMFDANNMPILCQLVRPEFRATGYGFMNLVSIATGAQATIYLGTMKDRGIPFDLAFYGSAAIAIVGAILILFVKPKTASST